jgi:cephalosporin hydroxylase
MDPISLFQEEVAKNVRGIGEDVEFLKLSNAWNQAAIGHCYAHNFSWLGRPIIQAPPDTYAMQELIWRVKPDLVIETGIAHGGSLIMSASMLALLDYCEAAAAGVTLTPGESKRRVIGIDIDIRKHNRQAIEAHPLSCLIEMYESSSVEPGLIEKIRQRSRSFSRVLIFLDSNHTHDHVLAELQAYAPLVASGSYCVVWDTGVEDLPAGFVTGRPWGKGNNPKTAVWEYLKQLNDLPICGEDGLPLKFSIDHEIEYKLAITAAPDGFLRRE